MKALRFHSFGALSAVLRMEEIPKPAAAPGDLLVEVKAAAINPSDIKNVQGAFSQTTLPRTPGRDFSGIVVSEGQFRGKAVWGTGPGLGLTRDGAHAQYISAPAEFIAAKPEKLSFEQAAAIGVPFTTAWAAVVGAAQLKAGETILIVGSSGAVGSAAVQIAKWKQARIFGADVDGRAVPGVQKVVNTTTEDMRAQVLELTGGKGVDVVFDVVGGKMFEPALRSLGLGGRQVAITSTGGSRVSFDLVEFYHKRAHLIGVDSNQFELSEIKTMFGELNRGFDGGFLSPLTVRAVPFEQAIGTYEQVAAHGGGGKPVLLF